MTDACELYWTYTPRLQRYDALHEAGLLPDAAFAVLESMGSQAWQIRPGHMT